MLSEYQCMQIEKALTEEVEPRKLAAYLCLHMGLNVGEATALRVSDLDFGAGTLTVRCTLSLTDGKDAKYEVVPAEKVRQLPMPPHVRRFLLQHIHLYPDPDCYLVNAGHLVPGAHLLQNVLFSINRKYAIAGQLTASKLRYAFIRRCIESGVDLYTIGAYVGIRQVGEIQKKFAGYLRLHPERMNALEKYGADYSPPEESPAPPPKRMNLLILGAGSQGQVIRETAEAIGVFNQIAFLDDDPENGLGLDRCGAYKKYLDYYPIALPSFGDCRLRADWIDRLEEAGFILPTLVHPMATVSPSARVGPGTIIEMKAIVSANAKIGQGCIISSGAIVDLNAVVGEYSYIGSAVTVKKDSRVEPYSRLPSGSVLK